MRYIHQRLLKIHFFFLVIFILLPGFFLFIYSDTNNDLEARIRRIESGLIPQPGIIIKGRPIATSHLAERMKIYRVPGVSIAVIKDFKIDWARGFGFADNQMKTPVTSETLFQAASISKPVAAAAALHFVDIGSLSLNEDVNNYLKTWKIPENDFTRGKKVTLKDILSHTAGLTVHGFRGYARDNEVPSLVQVLNGEKPANSGAIRVDIEPGSKWRYSGGGYTVMQQLLIDVLDKPFPEIMFETILDPLRMTHSTYQQPLPESLQNHTSFGHRMNGKPVKGDWHIYPEMAAAGLWTTPSDLCRFALEIMRALKGESDVIFSKNMANKMLTEVDGDYGLGFSLDEGGFGHGGSNEGFKCHLLALPDQGYGAAIMSNGDFGGSLNMEILRSLVIEYGWENFLPTEKEVIKISSDELAGYAGEYKLEPRGTLKIELRSGKLFADSLYVAPIGRKEVEIYPENKTCFFAAEVAALITFQIDESGEVIGLVLEQNNRKQQGKKIISPAGDHRLSREIKDFHLFSYYAGSAFMAAEIVNYDCKQLALSAPYSDEELEVMLKPTKMAVEEYGLAMYVEKDFLTTRLFDPALTKDKAVIFIARNQKIIDEYLQLKAFKKKVKSEGKLEDFEEKIARRFGRLLSYSDEVINRLLSH